MTKITLKAFGLHIGSQVKTHDGIGELSGVIETDPFTRAYNPKLEKMDFAVRVYYPEKTTDGYDYGWYNINDCQLLLTPLSEISDEDLLEVAKLTGWFNWYNSPNMQYFKNIHGNPCVSNADRIGKYESFCLKEDELLSAQADYLRSKSYALPYMGIDLFESGIAVKK